MYERTPQERDFARRHGIPVESDMMSSVAREYHDEEAAEENCTEECLECYGSGELEVDCGECDGSGMVDTYDTDHCDTCTCPHEEECCECDGSGLVWATCENCDGTGEVPSDWDD